MDDPELRNEQPPTVLVDQDLWEALPVAVAVIPQALGENLPRDTVEQSIEDTLSRQPFQHLTERQRALVWRCCRDSLRTAYDTP